MEQERMACPPDCLRTCGDVARPLAEAGASLERIQALFGLVGERLGVPVMCDSEPIPSKYFKGTYCPLYRYPDAVKMLQGAAIAIALKASAPQLREPERIGE